MNYTRPRAGAKLNDIAQSGFARVEVLNQQDLFPNEGFEFIPGKTKLTNSYKVSEDSPFTTQFHHSMAPATEEQQVIDKSMPQMIKTERLCTRAAAIAISTGTDGELRPLHSEIAREAVLKERQAQVQLKEKLRIARMKDEAHWAEIEQQEADATTAFLNRNDNAKRTAQRNLANVYMNELTLHKKREQQQLAEERAEAERNAAIQAEEDRKLAEKLKAKREKDRARNEELKILNDRLLKRKQIRREQEAKEAAIIAADAAKLEEERQAREERARTIRAEKDKRRERLITIQGKKLAEINARQNKAAEITESEYAKRQEADRIAREQAALEARRQRHDEWLESVRIREEKKREMRNRPATPTYLDPADEERDFEEKTRAEAQRRLREAQLKQIQERRAREEAERLENSKPQSCFFLKDNEW